MELLILGGAALGEQICRLAKAAGIHTILADRNKACPAAALADEFVCLDVTKDTLPAADKIIPATESGAVVKDLRGENILFDADAWNLTSSRLAADALLREHGVPAPAYFPEGSEPYIVKPDRGSFGRGIWVTDDYCEVGGAVNAGFVTQEELAGPVWSAVIVGTPGHYTAYAPARLSFDDRRRRIGAVCETAPEEDALRSLALSAAELVGVRGILEVEAIFDHSIWKVVDLNARMPMYTPDALLESGHVNLLEELLRV